MVWLLWVLVFEGQPELGPEDDAAAVLDLQVLLYHLGDPQVTERLTRGVHRGDRGVFPGLSAGPDDIDDPVHAHGILLDSGPGPGGQASSPGSRVSDPLFLTTFPRNPAGMPALGPAVRARRQVTSRAMIVFMISEVPPSPTGHRIGGSQAGLGAWPAMARSRCPGRARRLRVSRWRGCARRPARRPGPCR